MEETLQRPVRWSRDGRRRTERKRGGERSDKGTEIGAGGRQDKGNGDQEGGKEDKNEKGGGNRWYPDRGMEIRWRKVIEQADGVAKYDMAQRHDSRRLEEKHSSTVM